ncbi:hypothetical protein LSAT2_029389 [Lamellibrachia satsuma]|nr:hypothetical protein LSAT2_029389 [Lamellibrachia satsuma]
MDNIRSHVSGGGGVFPTAQDRKISKMINDPCQQDYCTRTCYIQKLNSESSNGAKFGGSPNDATAALRPSAHHASPVRWRINCKILLLTYCALHDLLPAYIVDIISPFTPGRRLRSADSNLLTVPRHDIERAQDECKPCEDQVTPPTTQQCKPCEDQATPATTSNVNPARTKSHQRPLSNVNPARTKPHQRPLSNVNPARTKPHQRPLSNVNPARTKPHQRPLSNDRNDCVETGEEHQETVTFGPVDGEWQNQRAQILGLQVYTQLHIGTESGPPAEQQHFALFAGIGMPRYTYETCRIDIVNSRYDEDVTHSQCYLIVLQVRREEFTIRLQNCDCARLLQC